MKTRPNPLKYLLSILDILTMLRNDDNLRAYAEYPLSRKTQPPNLLLCLSPGQSFPMTARNIKISKYTIGLKNFVIVNKQKKVYTTIVY